MNFFFLLFKVKKKIFITFLRFKLQMRFSQNVIFLRGWHDNLEVLTIFSNDFFSSKYYFYHADCEADSKTIKLMLYFFKRFNKTYLI